MNRVWKRFFFKLLEPVSFAAYFFSTMLLAEYTETLYGLKGFIAVLAVMLLVPMFAYMLRMTYRLAKDEIDRENQEVLDALKGK